MDKNYCIELKRGNGHLDKGQNLRAIFWEELLLLTLISWERFTGFGTNIHHCKNVVELLHACLISSPTTIQNKNEIKTLLNKDINIFLCIFIKFQ